MQKKNQPSIAVESSEALDDAEDQSQSYAPYEPSDDRAQSRIEQSDNFNII